MDCRTPEAGRDARDGRPLGTGHANRRLRPGGVDDVVPAGRALRARELRFDELHEDLHALAAVQGPAIDEERGCGSHAERDRIVAVGVDLRAIHGRVEMARPGEQLARCERLEAAPEAEADGGGAARGHERWSHGNRVNPVELARVLASRCDVPDDRRGHEGPARDERGVDGDVELGRLLLRDVEGVAPGVRREQAALVPVPYLVAQNHDRPDAREHEEPDGGAGEAARATVRVHVASRDLMFSSHDNVGSVLVYSPVWKGWIIINDNDGFNSAFVKHRKTYPSLVNGLSALERVSGRGCDDFAVDGL